MSALPVKPLAGPSEDDLQAVYSPEVLPVARTLWAVERDAEGEAHQAVMRALLALPQLPLPSRLALVSEKDPSECPVCGSDSCSGCGRARPRGASIFAPMWIRQLYTETPDAIDWLWEFLIPKGSLVLLAAFMKSGKTTLAYALIAALLRGELFLEKRTTKSKVLLLALEENPRDVKRRLRRFGVADDAGLALQFRPVPTGPSEWAALVEFVKANGIDLIVIDTLARCWPVWGVDSENDNAKVAAALSPLLELCRELDVTALLLHHVGKLSPEGHGREVRGAGAILALADQALLLDRYRSGEPCDRVLRVLGRYDESPAETIIRYDKLASTYTVVSQDDQAEDVRGAERLFPAVLTYLRRVGANGAALRDVRKNVHGRGTTKDRALELLVDQVKVVLRDGRYYHVDHDPETPPEPRVKTPSEDE